MSDDAPDPSKADPSKPSDSSGPSRRGDASGTSDSNYPSDSNDPSDAGGPSDSSGPSDGSGTSTAGEGGDGGGAGSEGDVARDGGADGLGELASDGGWGRLERAVAAIDAANVDDPATLVVDGVERPKELAHAELMTRWVRHLDPEATDAQLLAARAHHLRRWSIPRDSFPEGRAGYLRWRTKLKRQHAEEVGEILRSVGYDDATIVEVQRIVRKEGLGREPAVQVHEDALCIVFLQTQFTDVAEQLGDDKTIDVLRKTAKKMSPAGLAAAAALPLSPTERALLERALSADS